MYDTSKLVWQVKNRQRSRGQAAEILKFAALILCLDDKKNQI